MDEEQKWNELKDFIKTQYDKASDDTSLGRILKGFYKAIKDKMWSLDKKYN